MQHTKIAIVGSTPPVPEYIRMPKAGERDPLFGLSRTHLYSLVLPTLANDWSPPVRSIVLRRTPRCRSGVRLIHVASLRAYLEQQATPHELATAGPAVEGGADI
jgi:hypothetical protein